MLVAMVSGTTSRNNYDLANEMVNHVCEAASDDDGNVRFKCVQYDEAEGIRQLLRLGSIKSTKHERKKSPHSVNLDRIFLER